MRRRVSTKASAARASGTAADPYVISSAARLQAFAAAVDGGNTYAGRYVVLGADIDLSGIADWNPIGAEAKSDTCLDKLFSGTFDGRGHTVSGLKIQVAEVESEINVGLFSTLGNTAVVQNLNLTGADIDLTGTTDSVQCCAGILAGDTVSAAAKDDGSRGHDTIGARADSCAAPGTVDVAGQNGMVWAGGLIGPNDEITREQLTTMLYEYAKYKGYDVTKAADLPGFVDQGSVSDFAVGPMQWAVAQELICGVGGSAIAPQATATRAELAAVLHRFCEAFA